MATKKSITSERGHLLNSDEEALIAATADRELKKLSEDDLIELHKSVRRARNKYTKLYRRKSPVETQKNQAKDKNLHEGINAARQAELFEDALAQVSRRLSIVAAQTADELRVVQRDALAETESEKKKKPKKAKKAKQSKNKRNS